MDLCRYGNGMVIVMINNARSVPGCEESTNVTANIN